MHLRVTRPHLLLFTRDSIQFNCNWSYFRYFCRDRICRMRQMNPLCSFPHCIRIRIISSLPHRFTPLAPNKWDFPKSPLSDSLLKESKTSFLANYTFVFRVEQVTWQEGAKWLFLLQRFSFFVIQYSMKYKTIDRPVYNYTWRK